jgi:DNA-binding transcriptional MocR family regulator
MTHWIPRKAALKRPRYRSLVTFIEAAIEDGRLKSGERLPTHRDLSYQLGLSVQTVSRAYSRLVESGHIVGEVGRGSFVRRAEGGDTLPFPAQRAAQGTLDLALLKPVTGDIHKTALKSTLRQIADDLPDELLSSFRASTLINRHSDVIDRWLRSCGVERQEQALIPTNGNTSAMAVALLSVARSGNLIVTEKIGHHTLPALCRSLGLRLKGLEMDAEGITPTALDAACQSDEVKALYVMPRVGVVGNLMSENRRRALISVARHHQIAIIENDGWGPLDPAAPPPLATLAPERCYYFTSLTKCLAPGLRVGFLVVPEAAAATVLERHMVTNWMVTPLMLEIAAKWIVDGTVSGLLNWQRTALKARGRIATELLGAYDVRMTPFSPIAWLPCPDIGSEARLVERARSENILVAPGSTFSIGPLASPPGMRLSLGSKTPEELRRGLSILAGLASEFKTSDLSGGNGL